MSLVVPLLLLTGLRFALKSPPSPIRIAPWRVRAVAVAAQKQDSSSAVPEDTSGAEDAVPAPAEASSADAWDALQAAVDLDSATASSDPHVEQQYALRAAALLVSDALDQIRPFVPPAERYDDPPPALTFGSGREEDAALRALLGDDAHYVTDFLSEGAAMSNVHETFFQAELYLKQLQATPDSRELGEGSVREQQAQAETRVMDGASPELAAALEESVLVARQSFLSTVRFGYFLRRCQGRLGLERALRGASSTVSSFLASVSRADAVELARIATEEAAVAVDLRANTLFGELPSLLEELARGPDALAKFELSPWAARRLTVEAAAFGAALFVAEEQAARRFALHYTSFGSRDSGH
mmetsp:Transcript_79515/g.221249  ORF Transcript_79515/g.221249 Transcript_79515/m.221249 type:complete len:357 (-) Transcript_79515:8-1078(-)